ncbi:MAG: AMMECR1 domain-containing protein [Actinobacteria bacterium]|nr:AMMECR1 domain-containing protein [Actinomycetota bacterium]|tara:strand:+ start:6218 stop:6733 length:516 start_codon:yes stop_codon:yes gene_type:complete
MKDLLHLARESIEETVNNAVKVNLEPYKDRYNMIQSVFVTLQLNNQLRGCIGQVVSENPLWKNVYEMAKKAAFEDHRFSPVTAEEIESIKIALSILSPFEDIQTIEDIEIGKHGVMLQVARRTAVFLPEVATEQSWNKQQLLENLSKKAGLEENAYKEGYIKRFTTIKIKE